MPSSRNRLLALGLAAIVGASHGQPQITRQPANQSVSLGADVTFVVFASDGHPDLFVATWVQTNLLYRNTGQGSFGRVIEGRHRQLVGKLDGLRMG